jgi:4-amino-4-deoxy-L-arabinose transferase-like glycosyltransferase
VPTTSTSDDDRGVAVVAGVALADLALHVALSGRYGYWIDELYFIACGEHLAWGYVDHPPLIAAVAKVSRLLLGDSLFAIRLASALSGVLLVLLAGRIARELGGGRFAQLVAALSVFIAPVYLGFHGLLTMNAFEPLFWTACAWLAIRMVRRDDPRAWLAIGIVAGVGFLNKHSMAFFATGLVVAFLLTAERRLLVTKWALGGAALAALVALPHVLWQVDHGWPTLDVLRNARRYQHQPVTVLEFVWGQIQIVHPLTFPLWLAGVVFLVRDPRAKPFRFAAWTFLILFGAFMAMGAKTYYLAPIYVLPMAAGAVALERPTARPHLAWLRPATVVGLLVGGALLAPYTLPLLPITTLPRYLAALPVKEVRPETRRMGNVPQIFADELGWESLVAEVAKVYASLAPEERSRATIWGMSYGEAAAVDFFGRRYGLPPAVSGFQNYFLWGPGNGSGDVVIAVNVPEEWLRPWFDRVETRATVECDLCMPDRMRVPIILCRGLKVPLRDFWPEVKCWTCGRPPFALLRQ